MNPNHGNYPKENDQRLLATEMDHYAEAAGYSCYDI